MRSVPLPRRKQEPGASATVSRMFSFKYPASSVNNLSSTKSAAAQPKSAAAKKDKDAEKGATGNTRGRRVVAGRGRGTKRGRNAGRPKAKTADQLDAEMTDYFNVDADAGTNGTVAAAADGDAGMDEIA